jgi:hypothetical protein
MSEHEDLTLLKEALRIIVSLPATKTGLGLEEAKRYATRALSLVEASR